MITIKKWIYDPRIYLYLAPLILLSPVYLTGKALFWGTVSTQFVPWWDFAWRSILSGQTPLWNPLLGMGAPLVANYQSALFYPPTWVYFGAYLAGGTQLMAWVISLVVCGHLIWSGLGTANLLQDLEVNDFGQVVGGLAYSLSGYLVARAGFLSINAAAAWVPWLLLYLYRIAKGNSGSWIRLTGVLCMLLLAGHAQTAWMSFLLGGVWAVYWALAIGKDNKPGNLGRTVAGLAGAGLLAIALCAIQLFPTAEYLLSSQRSGEYGFESAMTYSFWPWRFLTLLMPELFGNPGTGNFWGYGNFWEDAVYIGLFPLLLAIGFILRSLIRMGRKRPQLEDKGKYRLAIFLGASLIISFLLALGDNTAVFPFLYKYIPGFDLFQAPTRYSIIGIISLAILAGLGANQLTKPTGRRLYFTRLAVAGCFSVAAAAGLGMLFLPDIRTSFMLSAGRVGLLGLLVGITTLIIPDPKDIKKTRIWQIAVICLICFDLISAGWRLNPGIKSDFYSVPEPKHIEGRVWMPEDVEYNLKFKTFLRFDTFIPVLDWEEMYRVYLPNLTMLQGVKMVNNFDPLVPGYFQAWMDRINDEYPGEHVLDMMNISGVVQFADPDMVDVVPRDREMHMARVAGCATILSADEDDPDLILNGTIDLEDNLIVYADEEIPCNSGGTGEVKIVEMRNGYLRLDVDPDQDGWIYWSQSWYPGWIYQIDGGKSRQVIRVNYLFQGAPVPAGAKQVEFIYRPRSFYWGGAISGSCLILVIAAIVMRKR